MIQRSFTHLSVVLGMLLAGCGGDGSGTDPGHGTRTLLVNGTVEYNGGGAEARVTVRRAGVDVTDALVRIASDQGEITLTHIGAGEYTGIQAGWMDAYALRVEAGVGGVDLLEGSIAAPVQATLTRPQIGVAFDPHLAPDALVRLEWSGDRAMFIRVKTKDYDPGYIEDKGYALVPNYEFIESPQDVELKRRNTVDLAGGAPGSTLRAEIESDARLTITNPFPG